MILEDDEELKDNEMSAFNSESKQVNNHDDSSLMRYSRRFSEDASLQQSSMIARLPKIKLISESELQSIENNVAS